MDSIINVVFIVVGSLVGLLTIRWALLAAIASKVGNVADKIALGADNLANVMEDFGMVKAPLVIAEGADVVDEAGELADKFAELTADGDLTAEDLKALFTEGKEGLWVELKDFRIKVFPKKVK